MRVRLISNVNQLISGLHGKRMVRPQIEFDPYKDEIIALFNQQLSYRDISVELSQRHSNDLTERTLTRRLQQWGLRRLPSKIADNTALYERIRLLVYDNLSDGEILLTLHREGFQISQQTLKRLRQQFSLRRRTDGVEAQRIQENQIIEVLRQEIQDGSIKGYGRGLLYTHLRQKGYVFPR
jgi:arginine repressor